MAKRREASILIIPGFGENVSLRDYREIGRRCKKELPWANVVFHQPRWAYRTAAKWIQDASQSLEKLGPESTYVLGFSLGAYVGLFLGDRFKILGAALCSLSPFFAEEMAAVPASARKFLGARRVQDFSARRAPTKLTVRPDFFFGNHDWPAGIKVAERLAKRYGGTFRTVADAEHELTPRYIDALVAVIKSRLG